MSFGSIGGQVPHSFHPGAITLKVSILAIAVFSGAVAKAAITYRFSTTYKVFASNAPESIC